MSEEAATHSAAEALRGGRRADIRALRPDDRADLVAAVGRSGTASFSPRFFGARHEFTEREIASYLGIDFVGHMALVAAVQEGGRPTIVGGRYVAVGPGTAEMAFAAIDEHQGRGIGAALLRHLAAIARGAGLRELAAEVLPHNAPMLRVFERSGFGFSAKHGPGVVHLALRPA